MFNRFGTILTKKCKNFNVTLRHLHLHEYESKQLLRAHGVNVQRGSVASSPEEAFLVAKNLQKSGVNQFVVKAQILAGGRGKGLLTSGLRGGVKLCESPDEVEQITKQMIGYNLITKQTKKDGEPVEKVLVLESVEILKELYLAILLDSTVSGVVAVGGVDIEEVARTNPSAVVRVPIKNPSLISREECMTIATELGLTTDKYNCSVNVADQIERLFDLFVKREATTVEINPLTITSKCGDHLISVDAKFDFDDNAAFRQQEISNLEDPREAAARVARISYVAMEGNIGCLVNGAGLAMATMDIVKLHGGKPANFLDVGGSASVDQVTEAFKIIQTDKNVKVILINIFGGIMRCDIIAQGLLAAINTTNLDLPLVVRLVGNRVKEGKELLQTAGKKIYLNDDLENTAKVACKLATT